MRSSPRNLRTAVVSLALLLSLVAALSLTSCVTQRDEGLPVKGFPIAVVSGTVRFHVRYYRFNDDSSVKPGMDADAPKTLVKEYTVNVSEGEFLDQRAVRHSVIYVRATNDGRHPAEIETGGRKLVIGNARGSDTRMTFIQD